MTAAGGRPLLSRRALLFILVVLAAFPSMPGAAEAKSKSSRNWVDRLENRRDARHAGIVAGAVTAQVAGAANRGRAEREYRECQSNAAAMAGDAQAGAYADPAYSEYAARRAGYDCDVQRYEDRASGRRAARRTAVVAGIVTREVVKD